MNEAMLIRELKAVGLRYQVKDGVASPSKETIDNPDLAATVIGAHEKPESDKIVTKLKTLLSEEQWQRYCFVRNGEAHGLRNERYDVLIREFMIGYILKNGTAEQKAAIAKVATDIPLPVTEE